MPSDFASLPFDVLLAICHEVDALSHRGAYKSSTVSGEIIGRRVVANLGSVPDLLLSWSAVNKRTRDACEPLIFGHLVFGRKWEAQGDLRWAAAKVRMKGMIQKHSLRRIVK